MAGRTGVYELMVADDELRELIHGRAAEIGPARVADLLRDRVHGFVVAVPVHHHARAGGGQRARNRAADVASRTGDDCGTACQRGGRVGHNSI